MHEDGEGRGDARHQTVNKKGFSFTHAVNCVH